MSRHCATTFLRRFANLKKRSPRRRFRSKRIFPTSSERIQRELSNWLGYKTFMPECFAPLVEELYAAERESAFDYIGLDYYDPFVAHMFRNPCLVGPRIQK